MAKGDLHAVIRLATMEIDELRRQIGALQRREDELMARDRDLDAQLARESKTADDHPEAAFTFASFLSAHSTRKQQVAAALTEVRDEITEVRDALADLFRQRKTYELAQEARDRKAAAERARKEQAVLDDIGLEMHRRRTAEDDEADQSPPGGPDITGSF
ncbi:hypothetical protein F1188_02910 [Roseospira marina]|uniref:Uncharacterized protein n=1 Tax=Roseospira marina TaxID=140057 RepID=A0A5M6IF25_9PROT|nr:flagellar export protein FliJ [Roseospira marina]KAA5606881.1 hypothetical protein F1188_02910 [Roseospira marina]MBB4312950.1 flagellar export protein FliJ [Roseospira marina]MBB5086277.1 flagellar export protein FliJ [Roseospira marina]